jgi:3',5'-cyclic AMP phosphodiesterase CpdA
MIRRSKETLASPLTQGASMPRIVCSNSQLCVAGLASYRNIESGFTGDAPQLHFLIDCIREFHDSDTMFLATFRAMQHEPDIVINNF